MKKLHPLHTPQYLYDYMRYTGEYYPLDRRTGRSTAQALQYLAHAICDPHTPVAIVDHYGTEKANKALAKSMQHMADLLGLKHMVFTVAPCTVTFTHLGEPSEENPF